MGKPTGFMEYERKDKTAEAPLERIGHFREFYTPLSKEEHEVQGARCMAYGVAVPWRSETIEPFWRVTIWPAHGA